MAVDSSDRKTKPPVFYLWPEHQEALGVFLASRTQWRTGFDSVTGLDYAAVEALIRMRRLVPRSRMPEVMAELQILEDETLAEWSRRRKEQSGARA